MTLHAPSYAGGFASPERGLIDRSLWDGVVGAWCPSLGATGLTVRDHSGRGNHGTVTGMTAAEAWADPAGMTFDGTDDSLLLGQLYNPPTMTVSLWFRGTDATLHDNLIGDTPGYFGIRQSTLGKVNTHIYDGANKTASGTSDTLDGLWHHAVATWNGTTARIYVDGIQEGSVAAGAMPAAGATVEVEVAGSGAGAKAMDADDVQLRDRAVTANEVATLYRLGPGGMYRRQQFNVKAPATGRINSLVGVGGGMIGYGGGMIGRGY